MSLRESFSPSIRAVHPVLFLVGLGIVLLQTGLHFVNAVIQEHIGIIGSHLLDIFGPFIVLVLTLPFTVGIYAAVREETRTARETLHVVKRAIGQKYGQVFLATSIAFLGAVAVAVVVLALAMVILTGVRYGQYTVGDPGLPNLDRAFLFTRILIAAALAVGVLLTRFADVIVAFGDGRPRSAWKASLSFARDNPISYLGYMLAMVVLLGTPQILPFAFGQIDDPIQVLAIIAAIVAIGTVGLVFASALHVTVFERVFGRSTGSTQHGQFRWTYLVALALVFAALVGGAGYVRLADVGTGQAEMQSLPDDHRAALDVAIENTVGANRQREVFSRNVSNATDSLRLHSRSAIDYDDRQLTSYIFGADDRIGAFFAEGTIALPNHEESWRSSFPSLTRTRSGWTIVSAPGYGLADPSDIDSVPAPGENYSVVASNTTTLVYRVTGPDAITEASDQWYRGMGRGLRDNSSLTIVVDRNRGVVESARYWLHERKTGNVYEHVIEFTDVGTLDLRRPSEIGSPSAVEYFWDVMYY